ncbi:MAG: RecF/RecN/SMC [Piptocephalis tieghemiana]|nr:MAG: RecF/RecN/SMC [Piptocephalis tieghemiana]
MRLKLLQVQDFKSYAKTHTFGPFDPFTCVIGPNGAGKSNLMDAISFVLGVQASHLRSSSLASLIHRPTQDSRSGQPLGPQSCKVTMYLVEDGDTEHRLERQVDLRGVCEYSVNGQSLSKKEYDAWLQERHIHVAARNFLVFQGDVETIASQSPMDLTRLLEKISGSETLILEYEQLKERQTEAISVSTKAYQRKRAMAAEARQLADRQAEAKRYQSLRKERIKLQERLVIWQLYRISHHLSTHQNELSTLRSQARKEEERRQELEQSVANTRKEEAKWTKDLLEHERNLRKLGRDADEQKPEVEMYEERVRSLEQKLHASALTFRRIQEDCQRKQKSVASLRKDWERLHQAHQIHQAKEEKRNMERQARLEKARRTHITLDTEQQEMYDQIRKQADAITATEMEERERLIRQIKLTQGTIQRMEGTVHSLNRRERELMDRASQLISRLDEITTQESTLQQDLSRTETSIKRMRTEELRLEQLEQDLIEKAQEIGKRLSEAQSALREDKIGRRRREALIALRRHTKGCLGTLRDLVSPTDRQFDIALRAALGRHGEAIVMEREKEAKECIQYARDHRLGVFTFLPLDTLAHYQDDRSKGQKIMERVEAIQKHQGRQLAWSALDCARINPRYGSSVGSGQLDRALRYALKDVVFVQDIAAGRLLCYEKGIRIKAVALDGTIFHKSGLLSGSAGGSEESLRAKEWTDHDVEHLMERRQELIEEARKAERDRRRHATKGEEMLRLQEMLGRIRGDLQAWDTMMDGDDQGKRETSSKILALERMIKEKQDEALSLHTQLDHLEGRAKEKVEGIFTSFKQATGISNIHQWEEVRWMLQHPNDPSIWNRSHHGTSVGDDEMAQGARLSRQLSLLDHQIHYEEQQAKEWEARACRIQEGRERDEATLAEVKQLHAKALASCQEVMGAADSEKVRVQELREMTGTREGGRAALVKGKGKGIDLQQRKLKSLLQSREDRERRQREVEGELIRWRGRWDALVEESSLSGVVIPYIQDPSSHEMNDEGSVPPVDYSRLSADEREIAEQEEEEEGGRDDGLTGPNSTQDQMSPEGKGQKKTWRGRMEDRLGRLREEEDRLAPSMRVTDRAGEIQEKFQEAERAFDEARREARHAKGLFEEIKQRRYARFMDAYTHVSQRIDAVYKALTSSRSVPMGGTAYLTLEFIPEEPYLSGVQYHAMPPLKRFREMDSLSGGEKTMAALALLFTVHSYRPAPFFVLDEVDAALDSANVAKVASFLQTHSQQADVQFLVISLKASLYEHANSLMGVYKDHSLGPESLSSRVLSLKVSGST